MSITEGQDPVTYDVVVVGGGTDEEAEQLAARSITVVEGEVASLGVHEDQLTGVRLQNGEVISRSAVVVGPRFAARAGMLAGLGLETTTHSSGMGEHIEAGATGLTAVPGVWVAGNVTDPTAHLLGSADTGGMAGATINADLIAEDTERAVTAYRAQRSPNRRSALALLGRGRK